MLDIIRKWFTASGEDTTPRAAPPKKIVRKTVVKVKPTGPHPAPASRPVTSVTEQLFLDDDENLGPGKVVLAHRPIYQLETGSYETLRIVDSSDDGDDNGGGIDPYNTGSFDRSRNWDKQFRK